MNKKEKELFEFMTKLGFKCYNPQVKGISQCYTKGKYMIFSENIKLVESKE